MLPGCEFSICLQSESQSSCLQTFYRHAGGGAGLCCILGSCPASRKEVFHILSEECSLIQFVVPISLSQAIQINLSELWISSIFKLIIVAFFPIMPSTFLVSKAAWREKFTTSANKFKHYRVGRYSRQWLKSKSLQVRNIHQRTAQMHLFQLHSNFSS